MNQDTLQIELKDILLEAYINLQDLDASKMLHETKDSIDNILRKEKLDTEVSKVLNEVSDQCFNTWAPMCEMDLSTYQEIEYFIIPKLQKLLTGESVKELDEMLTRKNVKKINFQNLKRLPSKNEDLEDDIEDFDDDYNDNNYTYEDGPFCSACQQSPCMCSDPERSSMTNGF